MGIEQKLRLEDEHPGNFDASGNEITWGDKGRTTVKPEEKKVEKIEVPEKYKDTDWESHMH